MSEARKKEEQYRIGPLEIAAGNLIALGLLFVVGLLVWLVVVVGLAAL